MGAGDGLVAAEAGAEFVSEGVNGSVVCVRIEFVPVEGLGDGGGLGQEIGAFVELTAGGGAEQALQGGERGTGDVSDGVQPVVDEGARGGRFSEPTAASHTMEAVPLTTDAPVGL
ncbi:hypothetical protein [Streptomyces sp. NPDC101234]|uniref:hypothetical protein n=1 Tax=Streptomyces sp. NPDC101234 TaxID=3366138 RepID=UPI003803F170